MQETSEGLQPNACLIAHGFEKNSLIKVTKNHQSVPKTLCELY